MVGDCQLCKLSDICKYIYAECCPYMKTEQRMNEEKCCGNFHWFGNEDIYGVGWCTINSCDVSCDFVCIRHIN